MTPEINRREPDDNIRVLHHLVETYYELSAEEVEKQISKMKAAAPPLGYEKLHDHITTCHRHILEVRVTSVYGKISNQQSPRPLTSVYMSPLTSDR